MLLTLFSWMSGFVAGVKPRFAARRAQVARLTGRAAIRAASQHRAAVTARLSSRGDDRL